MPIYEYRCNQCGRKTTVFARGFSSTDEVVCNTCGSGDLSRLISRITVVKSEESRLEDMADPSQWGDIDESDPRSMARWMRKMQSATGEDLGPEFDEAVERMEAGEMPDDLDGGDGGEDSEEY